MAKVSNELKTELGKLTKEELKKIVIRFARKYAQMNKTLEFELVESESVEELLEEVYETIEMELRWADGNIIQKPLAKAMSTSIAEINSFKKTTKSKYHEALALQRLLNVVFKDYREHLGTCWTIFDSKVASAAKRYFKLVISLHEDYHIEFKDDFEQILKHTKAECRHYDSIFELPDTFEGFLKAKKAKK